MMEPEPLQARQYWHGTSASAAACILVEGFRLLPPDLRYFGQGALGHAIYVTKNRREAIDFAEVRCEARCLLRVELRPGTRIARISDRAGRDLPALRREFGKDILTPQFDKAIPTNKQLKPRELFAILGHLHGTDQLHAPGLGSPAIASIRKWLRRLKYAGFGHPSNDLGIAIFDPAAVRLVQTLLPSDDGWQVAERSWLCKQAQADLLETERAFQEVPDDWQLERAECQRRRQLLDRLARSQPQ